MKPRGTRRADHELSGPAQPSGDISWLPPRPDPLTGHPRPPTAPVLRDGPGVPAEPSRRSALRQPPGAGAVLATWTASLRSRTVPLLIFMAVSGVGQAIIWRGFTWATTWWFWGLMSAVALLMLQRDRMAAGADWFRVTNRRTLRTYELTSLTMRHPRHSLWTVRMQDAHETVFVQDIEKLQRQQDIWDLVYNGICHSIANGATTNAYLWVCMDLPERLYTQVEPWKQAKTQRELRKWPVPPSGRY